MHAATSNSAPVASRKDLKRCFSCPSSDSGSRKRARSEDTAIQPQPTSRGKRTCMVTLASDLGDGIQLCQLVSDDLPAEEISKLEYVWGQRFDPAIPENIIDLTPSLLTSFEQGQWVLVPMDRLILVKMGYFIDRLAGDRCACIEDVYEGRTSFRYRFTPFPSFDMAISRRDSDDRQNSTTQHSHPYTTLPEFQLPIKPHLVVVNLAKTLKRKGLTADVFEEWASDNGLDGAHSLADFCENLYTWWMEASPPPPRLGTTIPQPQGKGKGFPKARSGGCISSDSISCGSSVCENPGDFNSVTNAKVVRPMDSVTTVDGSAVAKSASGDDGKGVNVGKDDGSSLDDRQPEFDEPLHDFFNRIETWLDDVYSQLPIPSSSTPASPPL